MASTIAGIGWGAAPATAQQTIVVAPDETGDYTSIQAAVDAASDGDRIEIRAGTYSTPVQRGEAAVTLDKNITVAAAAGAVLVGNGSGSGIEIPLDSPAAPVIDGLTVRNYDYGIDATSTTGDWTVRNVTVANNSAAGITAKNSWGSWSVIDTTLQNNRRGLTAEDTRTITIGASANVTLRNLTVRNNKFGIDGTRSDRSYTVTNSTIANNGQGIVGGDESSGTWRIIDTVIRDHQSSAVGFGRGDTGQLTIRDSTITNASTGVGLTETSKDVTIAGTRITDVGDGIDADDSTGRIRLRNLTIRAKADFYSLIHGRRSTGTWTLTNVSLSDGEEAFRAYNSSSDWTLTDVTITDVEDGVYAFETTGDWTLRSVTVIGSTGTAISLSSTTGQWRITDSVVRNNTRGIQAYNASGETRITNSSILNNEEFGVSAQQAPKRVDARGNWWGQESGPMTDQCVGNVDCGGWLSAPPSDVGGNEAPIAAFTARPATPTTGQQLTFNASEATDPDGSITSYEWDFDGDGTVDATGRTVTHAYTDPGTVRVTLTVVDDVGAQNQTSHSLTVTPATNVTVDRQLGSTRLAAGGSTTVTLTLDVYRSIDRLSVAESFTPTVGSASVDSITINGQSTIPTSATFTNDTGVVVLEGLKKGDTVTVTYQLTLPGMASSGDTYELSGNVTTPNETVSIAPVTVTVGAKTGAAKYAGGDRIVETSELRTAISDWVGGTIGTSVLREVIQAWVSGSPV